MVKVPASHDNISLTAPQPLTMSGMMSQAVARSIAPSATAFSAMSSKGMEGASETVITHWLEQLLRHFGIHELKNSSDQQLIELMASCTSGNTSEFQRYVIQDGALLCALKQRIIRLAGAQLDTAFVSMAPDVVNLEDAEQIALSVEAQILKGVRYQGEVYRLVESFAPCHRLQAFCLGQTLQERGTAYLITQSSNNVTSNSTSSDSFSVWVNVRALPRCSYRDHLPSGINITDLAC